LSYTKEKAVINFNNNFEEGQLLNVIRRRRQQDIQPSSYMKCIPNAMREENNKLKITTSYSVKQVASLEDINPKHAVVFKINMK